MSSNFIAFLIAATVLAVTPGPGIAYVVARTVAGGRGEGLASCLGTAVGGMAHVLAAGFGVSLVIAQSAVAFSTVKVLGAAYLVYLGIKLLRQAHPGAQSHPDGAREAEALPRPQAQGTRRAFFEGIVVEALNVKTALFFLAFLPQFISAAQPALPQLLLMGTICVTLNTAVDVVAVLAAHRFMQSGTASHARARLLQRISGFTMIGLGAYLALARRGD